MKELSNPLTLTEIRIDYYARLLYRSYHLRNILIYASFSNTLNWQYFSGG